MLPAFLKRLFTKTENPSPQPSLTHEQQALYDEMREMAARIRRLETQANVQTRRDY